jgi:hypothetical protein
MDIQVMETTRRISGEEHPDTLIRVTWLRRTGTKDDDWWRRRWMDR